MCTMLYNNSIWMAVVEEELASGREPTNASHVHCLHKKIRQPPRNKSWYACEDAEMYEFNCGFNETDFYMTSQTLHCR